MEEIKFSIIIPVYNEEKSILMCLRSLKQQTYKNFEIIIVDDGTNDGTVAKVLQYKKNNSNIKFLQQKHLGPASARNFGSKNSSGGILVFLDGDMTFEKHFLKKLTAPIISSRAKGTFSKDEFVSNWNNIWSRCWNINLNLPAKKRIPKRYPDTQKVFRAILKKEFDRVSGFSKGGYTDDYTLSEKLGYGAVAADKAVFYHANPDTLAEVYKQAKWVAKRRYKLGYIGFVIALLRSSLPVSILIGLLKSLRNVEPRFLIFKIVFDLGIFSGIVGYLINGKSAK